MAEMARISSPSDHFNAKTYLSTTTGKVSIRSASRFEFKTFQMQSPASQSELREPPWMLSSMNWRVWFLGYGIGGCAGLSMIAGIWSMLVDSNVIPGLIAIATSATHATFLFVVWQKRSKILAKPCIRNCFLLGSTGIATVGAVMHAFDSIVPSVTTLYSLAFMSFVWAFVMPLQADMQCGRTSEGLDRAESGKEDVLGAGTL